jgi:hypothetical protein
MGEREGIPSGFDAVGEEFIELSIVRSDPLLPRLIWLVCATIDGQITGR